MLSAAGCASTTTVVPQRAEIRFPAPLAGPGQPDITPAEHKRIERGWRKLVAGQVAAAVDTAHRSADTPQGRLLGVQGELVAGGRGGLEDLEQLLAAHPGYAAGWLTLSVAAEELGDEKTALSAARRGADLWRSGAWSRRADELSRRWVDDRIDGALEDLQAEDPEAALTGLERALALAPANQAGLLGKAKVLVALERFDAAEVVLAGVTDNAEALVLAGGLAARREDWKTAMELYATLPEDHPQRAGALLNARVKWRLANMPPYVQRALASTALTRAELAIILVTLTPQLEAIEEDHVPVLSDIVDLPYQREILAAVRLRLLPTDPLEHRFHPDKAAGQDEARGALEAVCHLLGCPDPVWCDDATVVSSCSVLPSPVGGAAFADLASRLAQRKAHD